IPAAKVSPYLGNLTPTRGAMSNVKIRPLFAPFCFGFPLLDLSSGGWDENSMQSSTLAQFACWLLGLNLPLQRSSLVRVSEGTRILSLSYPAPPPASPSIRRTHAHCGETRCSRC